MKEGVLYIFRPDYDARLFIFSDMFVLIQAMKCQYAHMPG